MRIVVVGGSGAIGSKLVTLVNVEGEVGRVEIPLADAIQGA
jgi:hypothetical protein